MSLTSEELLQSKDPTLLRYAAQDIGRALGGSREITKDLLALRRSIAEPKDTQDQTQDQTYADGFLAAIDQVSAGFIAARRHSGHLQNQAQLAASRPNWGKVLRALKSGNRRPGGIASIAGLQTSAVTRTINEMVKEGVVARAAIAEPGNDQRTRTVELTQLGQELCAHLDSDGDSQVEMMRELAPALIRILTLVSDKVAVPPERFEQLARQTLSASMARAMASVLLQEADAWGLVRTQADRVVSNLVYRPESTSSILVALGEGDSSFLRKVGAWAGSDRVLIRTSVHQRLAWDRCVRELGFDNFETLGEDDFIVGIDQSSAYSLVYESKPILEQDARTPEAQSLINRAHRKGCVVGESEEVRAGFDKLVA